jgi:hypothetical protein
MKDPHGYSWLLRFTSRVLKYFLLSLFGLGIVYLLSEVLGAFSLVTILVRFLEQWLVRVAVIVVCLLATTVVCESMR